MLKNNRGFTVIELIMSFVFTSILAISLFSIVLNYRNKEVDTRIENQLLDFKSNLIIDVQQDIQRYGLNSVNYCVGVEKCLLLTFNDGKEKEFAIKEEFQVVEISGQEFSYRTQYISYGGVKYEIPDSSNVTIKSDYLLEKTTEADDLENNMPLYKIKVTLVHSSLSDDVNISIVAPGTNKYERGSGTYREYFTGNAVTVQLNNSIQRNFVVIQNSSDYNDTLLLLYNDTRDLSATIPYGNVKFNDSRSFGNKYDGSTIMNKLDMLSSSWSNARNVRLITVDEIGYIARISPKSKTSSFISIGDRGDFTNGSYWTMSPNDNDEERKTVWYVDGTTNELKTAYVDSQYKLRPVITIDKKFINN